MCGINGIFAYQTAASEPRDAEFLATRDAMNRRGPDGSGAWWSAHRRCALGHRRLSILDLSNRAAQPMVSDDGRFVVTFNGEIYNYRALRAELESTGASFRTTSDTEVLLHLYARDGAGMVEKLRGMFAFAIWDNSQEQLFLARDPYGIKPLYTANDGWTFRFASQVKALLAGGQISRDPEAAGIVGFHLFGSVPEPFTLYRDIRALPAGHTQLIDRAGPREPKRFANLAAILAEATRQPAPAEELDEYVRVGIKESVSAHLVSDVEVGAFLSAGVDSGALLALMREVSGQNNLRAITLAFDEFEGTADDEAPLAARVASCYGAQHIVRRVSRAEFERDLPDILNAMDQPSIDGVNTWFIAKAAKECGLKVAISGIGGDELLAGYPSFIDLPRWRARYGAVASIPGLGRVAGELTRRVAPRFAARHPKALGVLRYSNSSAGAYLLRRGLYLPDELGAVLDPAFAREGLRRLQPMRAVAASLQPDPCSDIARVVVLESSHYMRNQLLRDADWAGMAHGIEIRVPLVDVALLKSLAPIIPELKPGFGKAALAHAPLLPLPDEVIARAKTGFRVPTADWMKTAAGQPADVWGGVRSLGLTSRQWSRFVLAGPGFQLPKARAA